jgi:PAS domain S-box-containing protein
MVTIDMDSRGADEVLPQPPNEALAQASHRLQESEERLRLAVAAGDIGIWDYYLSTGTLIWDDRCRQIHGAAPSVQISYQTFEESIHEEDRSRVQALVQRMLDPRNGGHYVVEYRVIGLIDRIERWVSVRGTVLFDENGKAVRFIGTTQDISEQKRIADTRERLIGIVGHDLRGPLSAIKTATALLSRAGRAPPKNLTDVISRSVDRMSAMISQLLDFTRIRLGGGLALDRRMFELRDLAEEIAHEVSLAHGGRVPVVSVFGNCTGTWDRTRMGQVVANLLHNALLHGSPEAPVTISLRGEPIEIVVEVHNEGTPISGELLPALFDPFRRGVFSSRHQGLGLGLFIASEIVLAHGGSIEVVSTPDAGTTFRVRMPRAG